MCNFHVVSFQKYSNNNVTCNNLWHLTIIYVSTFARVCMDYPKLACWLTNFFRNNWTEMAIFPAHIHAFSLVVDNFGIKYVGKHNSQHLIDALQQHYTTSIDWEGQLNCSMTLGWDYKNHAIDISMPVYAAAVLHTFQHQKPNLQYNSPSHYIQPIYGAKMQYV